MKDQRARSLFVDLLWLPPLVAVAFVLNLGGAPLFDLDEGAFSAATWEMLQRGDYVTTYLNGTPRFDKPILIYWLQAASVTVFGVREWAFRLPSAVAAAIWVLAVYGFARTRFDVTSARLAAVFTATTVTVVIIGRAATADALLNLLLALAMLDAYRYVERPHTRILLRVYAWMGLGMLAKGPIAVAIPFVVGFLYYASRREFAAWFRAAFNLRGWVVFLAIALPWYALEFIDQGQAFVDGFILQHNVGRFADTMEGHGGTPFYYLLALIPVLTPYGGVFLALLPGIRRFWSDPLDRWLMLWFAFVLVLFSYSNTQLPHYILYGCTPVFLLMARHQDRLKSRALAFIPPTLVFAVFVVLGFLPVMGETLQQLAILDVQSDPYLRAVLARAGDEFGWGFRLSALLMTAVPLLLWYCWEVPIWLALPTVGFAQTLILVLVLLPAIGGALQGAVPEAAAVVKHRIEPVVMWRLDMPSITVYRERITPKARPRPGEIVFTRVDKLDRLGAHQVLYQSGGVALAKLAPDAAD